MKTFECVGKRKDKNVIKEYALVGEDKKTIIVTAGYLKHLIKTKEIEVKNLKLTVDNRLIEKHKIQEFTSITKELNKPQDDLVKAIEQVSGKEKRAYLAKKTKSKRVGLAVKKCLLIGLASVSLSGTVSACGVDNTSYALSSQQESLSAEDAISIINDASELNVDTKNFKLSNTFVIMSEGQEVATAKGKALKIFDTIVLTTNTDEEIATGKEDFSLVLDKYTITDKDGNEIFYMKEKFSVGITKFNLYDGKDNYIGQIKGDDLGSKSAKILDKDDNEIGEISCGSLRKDFTITFSDDCNIDKVGLTSASCNYIATIITNQSTSGSHSSKSK